MRKLRKIPGTQSRRTVPGSYYRDRNVSDTTAYSARLTGVRTQKLALSNSLYNMLTFGSRMITALYIAPIGGIIDRAVKQQFDPFLILQLVLIGASIGTAMAILFMPTTVRFYELGIDEIDQQGS